MPHQRGQHHQRSEEHEHHDHTQGATQTAALQPVDQRIPQVGDQSAQHEGQQDGLEQVKSSGDGGDASQGQRPALHRHRT